MGRGFPIALRGIPENAPWSGLKRQKAFLGPTRNPSQEITLVVSLHSPLSRVLTGEGLGVG